MLLFFFVSENTNIPICFVSYVKISYSGLEVGQAGFNLQLGKVDIFACSLARVSVRNLLHVVP